MNTDTTIVCTDAMANFLGLFDLSIAPELLFYSYLPIIFISLLLGLFVLFKDNFSLLSRTFFSIAVLFSLFIFNELIQWLAVPAGVVYFSWSLGLLLNYLVLLATFYFVFLFVQKRDLNLKGKIILSSFALPVIIFLSTKLNVIAFNMELCQAIPGILWNYLYISEVALASVFFIWGIRLSLSNLSIKNKTQLSSILLLFGSAFFLLTYFASYYFADATGVYGINLTGPLGMIIFIIIISLLIIKFGIFRNIKLIATQGLVITVSLLVGSLLFVVKDVITHNIILVTFTFTSLSGYFLIKSVNKEVKLREEIENLALKFEKANERLKQVDRLKSEFVSIASHQLRSPLTSIAGYASLLREGNFGILPAKMKEPIDRIEHSARFMAESIEDYLNVSRIESGNMKYHLTDFNLRDEIEKLCNDLRAEALHKGLILLFRTDLNSKSFVNADLGKTQQIIHNLISNSIKYSNRGSITVYIKDDIAKHLIYVEVIDTGIGMSTSTLQSIFQKFERGDEANTINVAGTGLGLYVALKMAEAMHGTIKAYSEGEGKGSRFVLQLPLVM